MSTKSENEVGITTMLLQKFAWGLCSLHYFVEYPEQLKYICFVFCMSFYLYSRLISAVLMAAMCILLQFSPRTFTTYFRLAIFGIASKLPGQDVAQDSILTTNLVKTVDFQVPKGRDGFMITGVTGFTGIHFFRTIWMNSDRKIFCLIRNCKTRQDCARKIMKTVKQFNIDLTEENLLSDRVQYVFANFKHKDLGISKQDWSRIANEVDCIFHNAASLTYAIPYEILREFWIENCVCLAKFAFNHDISLNVMGSILGRCPRNWPTKRSFWTSGYARVNYCKELLMERFYSQGLKGSFFEVGFIGAATDDPIGHCQKKNPVLALFVLGIDCEAITKHCFNCIHVDVLVKMIWTVATNPKFKHIRKLSPSVGNVTPAMCWDEWHAEMKHPKIFDSPEEYLERTSKQGYNPMLVKHLILEIPFPNGVDDGFDGQKELLALCGLKDPHRAKMDMLRTCEKYGRDTLREILKQKIM